MRTIDAVLTEYPECPVCTSQERRESTLEKGETGFYVHAMLDSYGLDGSKSLAGMRLWECAKCATLWYDPWFASDIVAGAYGYLAGRHKYGWAALRAWAGHQTRDYFFGRPRILDLVLSQRPALSTYAEVNCPFAGLLFEILERRHSKLDRGFVGRKIKILSSMYSTAELKRDYAEPEAWRSLCLPPATGPLAHTRRLLIEEPSPFCWGHSCVMAGANCHAVARDLFVDSVVSFESLDDEPGRIDAIGIFNTLDHFPDPMTVLNKALGQSHIVIIDLHPWKWTDAQHQYNIGSGLTEYLKQSGLYTVDISEHVTESRLHGDSRRYLMVSATTPIAPV